MSRCTREVLLRLVDAHLQHLGDVLALVADPQRRVVEALAAADLAGHVDVGEEVHLHQLHPVALARLAAPALDVEAEAARRRSRRPAPPASARRPRGSRRTPWCRSPGCERGVRPMGFWSMSITLSRCSMPVDGLVPARAPPGSRSAAAPGPGRGSRSPGWTCPRRETPVTATSSPSGNSTVTFLRLFSLAPSTTSFALPRRRAAAGDLDLSPPDEVRAGEAAGFAITCGRRALGDDVVRRARRRRGRSRRSSRPPPSSPRRARPR